MTTERIVVLGASTVTQIFLARALGSGGFGELSAVLAATALLLPVAQGGLSGIAVKAALENLDQERAVFETALWWRLIAAVIAATIGVIFWLTSNHPGSHYGVFPLLVIAQTTLALQVLELRFLAHERMPELVRIRMAIALSFALVKISLASLTHSVASVAAAFATEFATLGMAHAWWCRVKFGDWVVPRVHAVWRGWFATRTPWLVVSGIAEAVNQKIDVLMLERIRGAHEAGVYAAAAKISEAWYAMPFMFAAAYFPKIIKAREQGLLTNSDWQRLLDGMFFLTFMVSIVLQWFAEPIVKSLFGASFGESGRVLAIHAWAGLFVGMRAVLSRWIIAEDALWISAWMACAGAVVNVTLNLWWIPAWGAQGAAWATVASYATAAWLALFFQRQSRHLGAMMLRSLLLPARVADLKNYLRAMRA